MTECKHELPIEQCGYCGPRRGDWAVLKMAGEDPPLDRHELVEKPHGTGRVITAQFDGLCAACGSPVHEGETIKWYPDTSRIIGPCCRLDAEEEPGWEP